MQSIIGRAFISLFCFCIPFLSAQTNPVFKKEIIYTKGYIGLSAGPSIPIGAYGDKEGELAGSADLGYFFRADFACLLGRNVGVAFSVFAQTHPVDTEPLKKELVG